MPTTVKINDLADFVICHFNKEGIEITPLKLQKILYYIQAWHLVFFDHPLFKEAPEAWVNGPVYSIIYKEYKSYKNNPIVVDIDDSKYQDKLNNINITDDQKEFLFEVLNVYGTMSAEKLVYLTHSEKPWNEARKGLNTFEIGTDPISFESMKNYYKARLHKQ